MANIKTKDYSISIIRLIATLVIFSCHIFQYFDIEIAWWLNVGVQIFLSISGYLCGTKENIYDYFSFVIKQFIKIAVDYLIVITIVILIHLFILNDIVLYEIPSIIFAYFTIAGGGVIYGTYHIYYFVIYLLHFYFPFIKNKITSYYLQLSFL